MILTHVSDEILNRDMNKRNSGATYVSPQLSIRNPGAFMKGPKDQKDFTPK